MTRTVGCSVFAWFRWAALLATVALLAACGNKEVDAVLAEGQVHLLAAERLLRENSGNEKSLAEAARLYRGQHGIEFIRLKERGERVVAKLSEAERMAVATQAAHGAEPILARIRMEAQRYPDTRKALLAILPLITAGTTRAAAATIASLRKADAANPPVAMPADFTPVEHHH